MESKIKVELEGMIFYIAFVSLSGLGVWAIIELLWIVFWWR